MKTLELIRKTFARQIEQHDCGIACLQSLIRYYGGENTQQKLREQSGTTITGTTLLGLCQTAQNNGFDADGCEADINALIEHGEPVILHLLLEGNLQHYVVCYGIETKQNQIRFVIGDPAKGIVYYTPEELERKWKSKVCLILKPNAAFIKKETIAKQKSQWIKNLIKDDISILGLAAAIGIAIATGRCLI